MTSTLPSKSVPAEATASAAPRGGGGTDLTERLRALRDTLLDGLVERDVAVRLALLAALSGEHFLLFGNPGTAKSLIARKLRDAFADATFFERLLTRFTVPEELFGPLSIKGLEEDRYERQTTGFLPTASVAFLDEIFKANSAILNALLTLLNEREFDNGVHRQPTPLISVVGASNELPEGPELGALHDRFLLRLHVAPVSSNAFPRLLGLSPAPRPVPPELKLTADDLRAIQETSEAVELTGDVLKLLSDLREWCTAEGLEVSDRRWRKIVKLLKVSAFTNGRDEVSIWDAWLLQHCVWDKPEDREKVYEWYAARVGASQAMDEPIITRVVTMWEAQLESDESSRSQRRNKKGQLLYRGPDGKPTSSSRGQVLQTRKGHPLFLAPIDAIYERGRPVEDRTNGGKGFTQDELANLYRNTGSYYPDRLGDWSKFEAYLATESNRLIVEEDMLPLMEPTRHKPAYVLVCVSEVSEHINAVASYAADLKTLRADLQRSIESHLWLTTDFTGPASVSLESTIRQTQSLLQRLEKVKRGFEGLPQEEEQDSAGANLQNMKEDLLRMRDGRTT